jgi:glycosyltransferase involved in cell wall biosynthesis
MRIVVDLQGAQTASRERGVGRYSLSFAQAFVRLRRHHEVLIVLNGQIPEAISSIRDVFRELLPSENIRVWMAPHLDARGDVNRNERRLIAQKLREAFIAELAPDFVLITSLFEGMNDEALTSVGEYMSMPTVVVLYDLIPFIHREIYLGDPDLKTWYLEKVEQLKRANYLLSISNSSGQEAITWLGFESERVRNISSAAEEHFRSREVSGEARQHLEVKHRLTRPFVMYTGGIDHRKNIEALIRAYSKLRPSLRSAHQLAIVCSVQKMQRDQLNKLSSSLGLKPDEVILTGYVSEEDLVLLYNACKVFVFPSWHEGFGLPVLEAMQCGKAVIASNNSSLPEVVGRSDSLFNPYDQLDIVTKLAMVLENDVWRQELERHSKRQAQLFGWDVTAESAWNALETWQSNGPKPIEKNATIDGVLPKLAFVSPLPPERSGISDYSAVLLREIAEYYRVEVIVDQKEVSDEWVTKNCAIRTPAWFLTHHREYDRVLYHFGNSHLHQHMFDLLSKVPGVVVLHDFFLSGVQAYREGIGLAPHAFSCALQHGHGFGALRSGEKSVDAENAIWKYPCNLSVLQDALGIIVHSEHSRKLAKEWYGKSAGKAWNVIPLLRAAQTVQSRNHEKTELGWSPEDFLVCSFGMLGPTKLNHRLLDAFLQSPLAGDNRVHLLFVGENDRGDYGAKLVAQIEQCGLKHRIHIVGWIQSSSFRKYLSAADLAVQLRTMSRGETSAAVLDCLNYGIPTIVNSNGSMADFDAGDAVILRDDFEDVQLVDALSELWRNQERRIYLGVRGQKTVHSKHSPDRCASLYADAIEKAYDSSSLGAFGVIRELEESKEFSLSVNEWARAFGASFPPKLRLRQLLVDVSTLIQVDSRSGIQRVTRAILREWLLSSMTGWVVEPVYATQNSTGYRYARQFSCEFLGVESEWAQDLPVDVWQGDVFVGLDLQPEVVPIQLHQLQEWRNLGAAIWFVVYDLLPLQLPDAFPAGVSEAFERWLNAVVQADGVACISSSVAIDLRDWISASAKDPNLALLIESFQLGADIEKSVPSRGLPQNFEAMLTKFSTNPTFLAVGTLEPRKGISQLLDAFELLWRRGSAAQLVIVGKVGWSMDELVERLRSHPEVGKRLFWLDGVSDEYLEKIYQACSCLVAASQGEGFGLPLVEAAQKGISILARDLPVFREVAGSHASYFSGLRPEDLSAAIDEWLTQYAHGTHQRSTELPWLTWNESANMLLDRIGLVEAIRCNKSQIGN